MAINIKNAPSENIEQFLHNVEIDQQLGLGEDHQHLIPHKIYDLTLDNISQGRRLNGMAFSGWRYLFQDEDGAYHAAEIGVMADTHMFRGVDGGEHVDSFISTYDALHEHALVMEYNYEFSYLRIPHCGIMAIWLKGDDHHHEMMIPLAPMHPKFKAGESYSARRFMDIVESIAREIIKGLDAFAEDALAKETLFRIQQNDLTLLLGINAQIETILKEIGIETFADVIGADPGDVESLFAEIGVQFPLDDPIILLEQAALADEGRWEELLALQEELKRRF